MDDEAETYKLWRIRKTVMQVSAQHNLKWSETIEPTYLYLIFNNIIFYLF